MAFVGDKTQSSWISSEVDFTNLYIKGLWPGCSQKELDDLFCEFGTIIQSRIYRPGTAFVRFSHRTSAHMAKAKLDGTQPHPKSNTKLKITYAVKYINDSPKKQNIYKDNQHKPIKTVNKNNIYIRYLSNEYNENMLLNLCKEHGIINNVAIFPDKYHLREGLKVGFVRYVNTNDAINAIYKLNGRILPYCNRSAIVKFANTDPLQSEQFNLENISSISSIPLPPISMPLTTTINTVINPSLFSQNPISEVQSFTPSPTEIVNVPKILDNNANKIISETSNLPILVPPTISSSITSATPTATATATTLPPISINNSNTIDINALSNYLNRLTILNNNINNNINNHINNNMNFIMSPYSNVSTISSNSNLNDNKENRDNKENPENKGYKMI